MTNVDAGVSTDEEPLKKIFDDAMKLFNDIDTGKEATNSESVQMSIKIAIKKLEKATNLVSLSGMFSRNESLEELPTESVQYLLLPALLGTLTLKLSNQPRAELINVAEIYFRDYLQRCLDYGVTDIEVPQPREEPHGNKPQSEQAKITNMVQTRDAKIKRYNQMKLLQQQVAQLSKAMSTTTDEEIKRKYYNTLLESFVNQALDELSSIEQEKPILEYMSKHGGEPKPRERPRKYLKPVIITRDSLQKAVYGAGYPALPAMTVEEFYDQRVREGTFPGSCSNIPHTTIETTENDGDEADQIRKETLEEDEDEEERERQQGMDEYKDTHRRGWGNRHNRS